MKVENYTYPKSSFLSIEKDTQTIVNKMLANERLKRLLYYNTEDALMKPQLTSEQSFGLLKEHKENDYNIPALIRFVPKIYVDELAVTYIIVTFDNFLPSVTNPEFRDCSIQFDIICHYDLWKLNDMQLRPYKIAAEIDSMFDKSKLSGIGTLQFSGATDIAVSGKEFAGLSLVYKATHGEDDKKWNINDIRPNSDNDLEENFQAILKSL